MSDFENLCLDYVNKAKKQKFEINKQQILSLLDHTCLNKTNAIEKLNDVCDKANGIAGICVYPENVALVKGMLPNTKVISVANFPNGTDSIAAIEKSLHHCLSANVDEIDLVFPYKQYLSGDTNGALSLIQKARQKIGPEILLKVILETSQFPSLDKIHDASLDCIAAGADFIKTSTGTLESGASLEATAAILLTIKQLPGTNNAVGCKISGGLSQIEQLEPYLSLASLIFDQSWLTPKHFRIGASRLLDELQS